MEDTLALDGPDEAVPSLFPGDPDRPRSPSTRRDPTPEPARQEPGRRGILRGVARRLRKVAPIQTVSRALRSAPVEGKPVLKSAAPTPRGKVGTKGIAVQAPMPQSTTAVDPRSAAAAKKRSSSRDEAAPAVRARPDAGDHLPTLEHAGLLPDLPGIPDYLLPPDWHGRKLDGVLSCGFCGVGDSGSVRDRRPGKVGKRTPTAGCGKLDIATGHQGTVFPLHVAPSILDRFASKRREVTYEDAVRRLADLILDHREPDTQILVYGCGQIDYFTIFAMQEIFRLLGVRNIAGNAEHCLNAGAVHNEMLTGQEGPFLTFDGALDGPDRFFLLNGWNGKISHPGAWDRLMKRDDLDGYLVDVLMSESGRAWADRVGEDKVLLIRSGSDPHLALSVAHTILADHRLATDPQFLERFADYSSWRAFSKLAKEDRWDAAAVAERIAPEPHLAPRLEAGIRGIAARFAEADCVPINIPSVGLSQTKGAVSHCLWGNALAMLGKYGLRADGTPAGGVLRIPGQINAESEVQALSRAFFFGRIPVTDGGSAEAARRMGLPDDSYELAVRDDPRPVLDYSVSSHEFDRELVIAFGTQFEANMMDRERWVEKLTREGVTVVAVDPVPDPWSLSNAHLVIPTPPHSAAPKLYQNGEWRLTLSSPRKERPEQTRSDATLLYDTMAEISRRIRDDSMLRMIHPDLGYHSQSGYLKERFERTEDGGGLPRYDGEVSRWHLWQRVHDYMADAPNRTGPLYCAPNHADGTPIAWEELVEAGHLIYGGVGETRYKLDYDDPDCAPYRDIFQQPGAFRFFDPTDADLALPEGLILNSGRSAIVDDPLRYRFALDSFNSGKATPAAFMPDENPLYLSATLAAERGIAEGDLVRISNTETGRSLLYRAHPTDRLVGPMTYTPFHKDKKQVDGGRYLNTVTSQSGRCPYTAQGSFKSTSIHLERAED